ncbi:hypothetical protein ACQCX2_10310 [Propionibacteriaceae bacterium Y1700]|uniref:hypothetical protein n=1 Tax=Microlunatus sp. Y1700 TaxID=3418487 RepID=UPI003DA6D46A
MTTIAKPRSDPEHRQPGDVRTMFASSGQGIQLRYGRHAGRLLQQYSGHVRTATAASPSAASPWIAPCPTRLTDGWIGVFWEADHVNDLRFSRFDDAWLGMDC